MTSIPPVNHTQQPPATVTCLYSIYTQRQPAHAPLYTSDLAHYQMHISSDYDEQTAADNEPLVWAGAQLELA